MSPDFKDGKPPGKPEATSSITSAAQVAANMEAKIAAVKAAKDKPKEIKPAELKERISEFEAETMAVEKKFDEIVTLEEENRHLKQRLNNFHRAIFSILYHATSPVDPKYAQRQVTVLTEGLESIQVDEPTV
jgi:hypothetical protein